MKFVKYNGHATGYLLINKKRRASDISAADEVPVPVLYRSRNQVIAVSDRDFEIVEEQGHIAGDNLQEVEKPFGYGSGDNHGFVGSLCQDL
ncbi:MAG: hypothetical protein WCC94_04940 [Candidatus Bathyarchaeia archaeon]